MSREVMITVWIILWVIILWVIYKIKVIIPVAGEHKIYTEEDIRDAIHLSNVTLMDADKIIQKLNKSKNDNPNYINNKNSRI